MNGTELLPGLFTDPNWRSVKMRHLVAVYPLAPDKELFKELYDDDVPVPVPATYDWLDVLVAFGVFPSKGEARRAGEKPDGYPEHIFGERQFGKKNISRTVWISVWKPNVLND